ncbi:MAG: anthranilate phosphoribosyltransferase [Clostridia bacterium]|nr:anthranilate phosphoribosyltransferase [Clostridia bacterium]
MLKFAIHKLIKKENLTEEEMIQAMNAIMEGNAPSSQIGSFLTALRMKGENVDEITGGAKVMREKALKVTVNNEYAVDPVGTGGDGVHTFNISTLVSIVTAASGVKVVKHGNRSVSSKCGSADVLESLGVNIQLTPVQVKKCVDEIGIGFMFAPRFHEAMKNVIKPRKELGFRTIFNLLGPLTNPALVKNHVLGVYDPNLTELMANVLKNLGSRNALVVHGLDGLDEITITTETKVTELKNNEIFTYYIRPKDFNFSMGKIEDLVGGAPGDNANILLSILEGEQGPKRDITLLNAGAAIYVGGQANTLTEGIEKAKQSIDQGLALNKLTQLITLSKEFIS